jgi:hypothetical protein
MLYDLVLVKALKSGTTKESQRAYPIVVDQSGNYWRLFNGEHVELNKAYTFGYEFSEDKKFKNIKQVLPLTDVYKAAAIKELANLSDIKKDISVCLSYSVDLVVGGKLPTESLFDKTDELHSYLTKKANEEYEKLNPVPEKKDIK